MVCFYNVFIVENTMKTMWWQFVRMCLHAEARPGPPDNSKQMASARHGEAWPAVCTGFSVPAILVACQEGLLPACSDRLASGPSARGNRCAQHSMFITCGTGWPAIHTREQYGRGTHDRARFPPGCGEMIAHRRHNRRAMEVRKRDEQSCAHAVCSARHAAAAAGRQKPSLTQIHTRFRQGLLKHCVHARAAAVQSCRQHSGARISPESTPQQVDM